MEKESRSVVEQDSTGVSEKVHRKEKLSSLQLKQHTKIFASMCPDEILDYYDNYETREYNTTLMLGDISGFTELTEKYTKAGKGGPSKVTETLNSYIGAMVQEILSHNGDVLKFSGDAFIVMWKLQEGMIMRDIAIEAMQTACVIQKHFGVYKTDIGVTLRVKLAIASGKTYFTSIGNPKTMSYYVITGKPVWDVKFAEGLCRGGDILVAPSSWQWANPNEYIHERLPDGKHILIIACSAIFYQSRTYITDERGVEELYSDIIMANDNIPHTEADAVLMNLTGDTMDINKFKHVDYSLRPKVIKVAKAGLKDSLRSYMLRPVIRSVEMNEPLEHLTEMRQVVIVFVNAITETIGRERLVSLVETTYQLVCRIVGEMRGCVNKISLFDKDLIFLCVFGLRGDKHELESQIGLRCASKIQEGFSAIEHIESVTVAVTTGMTYCGVVGHVLRREYTVIGMPVNKAARLMCAYHNKVICDRESFLRSHLEARHFVLQEPRYLKGITNIGPVYEFHDRIKEEVVKSTWNKYPLLGRDEEIKISKQLFRNFMGQFTMDETTLNSKPECNVLIIKGEPRIGKTRLLDEIAQNIPNGVSCNYISLTLNNVKISYSLIRLIFSTPLGLDTISNTKERENNLISRLKRIRQPEFLCVLNQPFNVHFTISERYKALSKVQKRKVLRKFLLKLMKSCFRDLWVVIIDDAEYGDDDSMLLFRTIIKQNTVFFVLGVGTKFTATEYKFHPSVLKKAHIIELHHIDKWYHVGLACQILNVCGIPVELEKLIQEKSHGNPGWIESYLLSLIQSNNLVIVNIRRKEAEQMGYVIPDISMLQRSEPKDIFTDIDEEEKEERSDRWEMYRMSFQDSEISLLNHTDFIHDTEIGDEEEIAVCKFTKSLDTNEMNYEITMDSMILKLFDSLTPLDQLLLKTASVLGEIVNRRMLYSLLEDITMREIGLVIKKLFEVRIFGCAAGDFSAGSKSPTFYKNIRNVNIGTDIICQCIGIVISDELTDLPQYASCGLMRFKISMFRETTYGSLIETQKIELHSKALKYLQRHTRRCMACGELQFAKLLGRTITQERNKSSSHQIFDGTQIEVAPFKETSENDATQWLNREKMWTCFDIFREVERKLTRTFSDFDFTNCECHLILTTAYSQMLEHCRGIGKKDMILTAILEFVEVCLDDYNIPQACRLLSEAETLLHQMFDSSEEELVVLPYLTGKIQTLQGRCYLESGLISEAKRKLQKALKSLGYNFPRHRLMIDLKSTTQLNSLKWKLVCSNHKRNDITDPYTINYIEQLANCLAQMFDVFRSKGMKKHARLAAVWGLNAVLYLSKDFFTLCTSFTNMMITTHVYQNKFIISCLENEALKICAEKGNHLEFFELKVITELYAGIFFSRWLRGEINKAIRFGFITIRMAQTINSGFLKLLLLPRLVHLLTISCRHSEIVALLRELEFESQNDLDRAGRTWYYAICADVQLDIGFTILSYEKCEQYYLRNGEDMINLRDPEAERRYFTSMWLWCIRKQQWEALNIWNSRNVIAESMTDENMVSATITMLKKLEGLLILYVREVTGRNINALSTMVEIKNTFKYIEKVIKIVKIAIPRYILLKAYYYMIQSRKGTAIKMLQQAKKLSIKVDNRMIYAWTNHCQQVWSGAMSSVHEDLWKEKSRNITDIEWDEINANESAIISFTFPLPK